MNYFVVKTFEECDSTNDDCSTMINLLISCDDDDNDDDDDDNNDDDNYNSWL